MLASTVNSRILLRVFVLAFALAGGFGVSGTPADDFLDDARIKSEFETRLTALFEEGGVPTGSETRRQLREIVGKNPPALLSLPTAPGTSPALSAVIYQHARRSTLVLGHLFLCDTCDAYHASLAGGVIIHPDGLALTNYHVLDNSQGIVFGAMTSDGQIYAIEEVVAASEIDDIALIRLRHGEELPYVPLRNTIATGDELFVISHPDGFFHTLTKGYLSRKYLTPEAKVPRLQITADFAKGSSGAGIFNTAGELVGLTTATNSIYSETADKSPGHLQMVIKSGVPISSVQNWFAPEP